MAYVLNDPADFTDEFTAGFAAANDRWVSRVPGGVIRAAAVPEGQVVVITGGGTGHYPAFAGLVGPGLAHGAALGNVFASPSAQQVYSVAKAAHAGAGVLLTYGNYAGDVLNFTEAQNRLRAEGIACETVVVTDDIASAAPSEHEKRRGIAGDLFVFKAAAAAAEAGRTLQEVAAVATEANTRTRSLGVAFSGCTLPGADHPLFTVPQGRMGVGMGIHGEPGIDEQDIPSANELAELLVQHLLAEKPVEAGNRAVVLLNGLGGVKYEELFVLYGAVAAALARAGVDVVSPDVGELVTSFEMAGVSLTLAWLTEELEKYWNAPVSTPAYRRGNLDHGARRETSEATRQPLDEIPAATSISQAAAHDVSGALQTMRDIIDTNVEELGRLDAVAGDGDHGIGMQRGSHAAADVAQDYAERGAGAGSTLISAGNAWADRAGGTSGALWGLLLRTIGAHLGDTDEITSPTLSEGITAACEEVQSFGRAEVGDKTMVDAIVPFARAFGEAAASGESVSKALIAAADAAQTAAMATADLVPKVGRARSHTTKSVGTPDPGAFSFALIARAVAARFAATE